MSKIQPLMALMVGSVIVLTGCSSTRSDNFSVPCAVAGAVVGGVGVGAATSGAGIPGGTVGGFFLGGSLCSRGTTDKDGDGVADDMDKCPGTASGVTVDQAGCPLDSDQDGVADNIDQCPNTPMGTTVDAQGCPADSDGDGVTDDVDACPNTPAGSEVNKVGCVPPVVVKLPEHCQQYVKLDDTGLITHVTPVQFDFNSAAVNPHGSAILSCVAQAVDMTPQRLQVDGYTDSVGSSAYNIGLSQRRANSARAILIEKGVKAAEIDVRIHGESNPVVDNEKTALQYKNRRVEISHQ